MHRARRIGGRLREPRAPLPATRMHGALAPNRLATHHALRRKFPDSEGIAVEVQVFGTKGDADTRKALRFFSERRIKTHFVDLRQRAASKGELRRFVQRFGTDAVVDRESKRFRALGLHTAHYGPDRWLDILADEPLLLRQPLVRWRRHLTVGLDQDAWASWLEDS